MAVCDAVVVHTQAPSAPTTADVRRIGAIANPVIRNLEITECYARLAAAFAARSGGPGANWCTYATWASRQAGETIRGEDLLDDSQRLLCEGRWLLHPLQTLWRLLLRRGLLQPETRLGRLTAELHTPLDAIGRASEAVARGNLTVFAEIGLEFARRLEQDQSLEHFLDGLSQGEPPDGQRLLRQAFTHYEEQRAEPDPKRHAELGVLASLEIGLHEQTRLQEQISEALNAPFVTQEQLGLRALVAVFPAAGSWWKSFRRPAVAAFGALASALQRASTRLARKVITESFMVLSLPGRVLALGTNLADPFPKLLREPTNTGLIALVAQFEPVPPVPDDCAARDWSDLHQRMHYISHLFRAFHLDETLARSPFTSEQVASFQHGVVPEGNL
jgi:hypothetical protein